MGGRGCPEVQVFAAASLTAGALAACAAACPPHLSSFAAGTCPAWKKVLLQQVGRALALWFAEDSGAGSRTAARRGSAAAAALQMLPGGSCGSSSLEKSGLIPPASKEAISTLQPEPDTPLLDFGAGLGAELDPLQPRASGQEHPPEHPPFPAPRQPRLCSLIQAPFPSGKLGVGIPVGGDSPEASHGSSQEEPRQ